MAVPTWVVGEVLTASDVNSWFVPLAAYKTTTLSRTTTPLAADPDLQFSVAANAFYEVRASLLYQGPSGVGFNFGWTTPAGVPVSGFGASFNLSGTGPGTYWIGWPATTLAGTLAGTSYAVNIQGTLQTASSGGPFGVQWASGAAGQQVNLSQGSYLLARRIG